MQRDVARGQQRTLNQYAGIGVVGRTAAHLRFVVCEYRVAVDDVFDHRITKHHRFDAHPLVTVVRDRIGIDAVRGHELAFHHHIGAWRTEVAVGARALTQSAQQLHFQRNWEVLFESHTGRGLRVHHDAVVANGPTVATAGTGDLLSHKPVFGGHDVVREWLFVKNVPEFTVEIRPLIVPDLEHTIGDAERIAKVFAERMSGEFDVPVLEVLAIEHR